MATVDEEEASAALILSLLLLSLLLATAASGAVERRGSACLLFLSSGVLSVENARVVKELTVTSGDVPIRVEGRSKRLKQLLLLLLAVANPLPLKKIRLAATVVVMAIFCESAEDERYSAVITQPPFKTTEFCGKIGDSEAALCFPQSRCSNAVEV